MHENCLPGCLVEFALRDIIVCLVNHSSYECFRNPTPGTSALLPVEWKPITNGSASHYLEVDKELTAKTRPFQKSMAFWELFYRANADLRK